MITVCWFVLFCFSMLLLTICLSNWKRAIDIAEEIKSLHKSQRIEMCKSDVIYLTSVNAPTEIINTFKRKYIFALSNDFELSEMAKLYQKENNGSCE